VSATVTLHFDAPPVLNVTGGGNFCYGAQVTLTASGSNVGGFTWWKGSTQVGSGATYSFVASSTSVGTFEVRAVSTDACANPDPKTVTVTAHDCLACTLTQGAWGSVGGAGTTTGTSSANIRAMLQTALTVGTLTIQHTGTAAQAGVADCVMAMLPGNSTAGPMAGSAAVVYSGSTSSFDYKKCQYTNLTVKNGKVQNVLLGQTISLGLNLRWSNSLTNPLSGVSLCKSFRTAVLRNGVIDTSSYRTVTIPDSVLNYLNGINNATVGGLFDLASNALA
jgi:hypothetical protein